MFDCSSGTNLGPGGRARGVQDQRHVIGARRRGVGLARAPLGAQGGRRPAGSPASKESRITDSPSAAAAAWAGPLSPSARMIALAFRVLEIEGELVLPVGRVQRAGRGHARHRDEGRGHFRPASAARSPPGRPGPRPPRAEPRRPPRPVPSARRNRASRAPVRRSRARRVLMRCDERRQSFRHAVVSPRSSRLSPRGRPLIRCSASASAVTSGAASHRFGSCSMPADCQLPTKGAKLRPTHPSRSSAMHLARFSPCPSRPSCRPRWSGIDRLSRGAGRPRDLDQARRIARGCPRAATRRASFEFLMAEAIAQGADMVMTQGATQSEPCPAEPRLSPPKLGIGCHILLEDRTGYQDPDYTQNGNVLLDHLHGATTEVHPAAPTCPPRWRPSAEAERAKGRTVYTIPGGGSNPTGALGYVNCALKLLAQANDAGLVIDRAGPLRRAPRARRRGLWRACARSTPASRCWASAPARRRRKAGADGLRPRLFAPPRKKKTGLPRRGEALRT